MTADGQSRARRAGHAMSAPATGDVWTPICEVDKLPLDRGVTALVRGHAIAVFLTPDGGRLRDRQPRPVQPGEHPRPRHRRHPRGRPVRRLDHRPAGVRPAHGTVPRRRRRSASRRTPCGSSTGSCTSARGPARDDHARRARPRHPASRRGADDRGAGRAGAATGCPACRCARRTSRCSGPRSAEVLADVAGPRSSYPCCWRTRRPRGRPGRTRPTGAWSPGRWGRTGCSRSVLRRGCGPPAHGRASRWCWSRPARRTRCAQGDTARAARLLEEVWRGPVRAAHLAGRGRADVARWSTTSTGSAWRRRRWRRTCRAGGAPRQGPRGRPLAGAGPWSRTCSGTTRGRGGDREPVPRDRRAPVRALPRLTPPTVPCGNRSDNGDET